MRVLFASLLALAAVLGGCGGGGFQTSGHDAARVIGSAPTAHAGELHAFSGRVVDAHETSAGYEIQLSIATVDPTFVVIYPVRSPLDVLPRDYVRVLGRVSHGGAGLNGLGGYQRAVFMDGVAVLGERSGWWIDGEEATYEAWRAGTLQLGSRGPIQPAAVPVAASAVGQGK